MFRLLMIFCFILSGSLVSMDIFPRERTANNVISRVKKIYHNRYGLNIIGVTEGADDYGRWTILGVSLQDMGNREVDDVRRLVLDCRSILLEEINTCSDAEHCFASYPFENVRVIICSQDALDPFVSAGCYGAGCLTYYYNNSADEIGFSREVKESLAQAVEACQ